MGFIEKVYSNFPFPIQNLACSLRSLQQRRIRFGGIFKEKLAWLKKSEWWSSDEIENYQIQELRRIIEWSYNKIPYYNELFVRRGILPSDIDSLDSLKKLPILTKEDLLENFDKLLAHGINKDNLVYCKTGGTTGKSVSFFQEREAIQFRWAVWWRHKLRFGVNFNSSYATFTGLAAVPVDCHKPPFWRENRLMKQTIFNMHHITPKNIRTIVARLNQGGFDYYSGYPSILYHLATLIESEGLAIDKPPKMIFTGAETLMPIHQFAIEKVFNAKVSDLYGFSEGAANASKCEAGVYHEDFEFGILECYNPEHISKNKVRGEIVATGFASDAMPLIRYKVGDIGIWENIECSCGRKSKILTSIEGRCEDYIILPEGGRIRRFDYIFKDSRQVLEAQVIQKQLGSITIKIVKRDGYSSYDESSLRDAIKQKISPCINVSFEYVESIDREANGKFRAVKSMIGK